VSLAKYAFSVLGITTATLAVVWPMLGSDDGPDPSVAVLLAATLAMVNTVAAYGLVLWSSSHSTRAFMRAVLGGMIVRMALMLVAVVMALRSLELPAMPFVITLLGYFVTFQVYELAVIQRRGRAVREGLR